MGEDRIFVCRFGLRPCYIIASNALMKEMLNERTSGSETYNGLKDFFFGLFGHSIMFAEAQEASNFRQFLVPLLKPSNLHGYNDILDEVMSAWILREMTTCDPLILYDKFKKFSTMLTLRLFLGVEGPEAEEMAQIATQHWHGIISVPLNLKLSFGMSSSYRKALEAKDKLLEIIGEKLEASENGFIKRMQEENSSSNVMDVDTLKNHILLFTCALIPKALASLLTSLIDSSGLWYDKIVDKDSLEEAGEDLENVLLEIVRLWPPFFGGLRVAEEDFDLGSYHVPKGYGIFCATFMAHRDPTVFPDPDAFKPERWAEENKDDRDKIFGFGAGPHRCPGENLIWNALTTFAKKFIKTFEWDTSECQCSDRNIKYLPVMRPRQLKPVILKKRASVS